MPPSDYDPRALALPIDDSDDDRAPSTPSLDAPQPFRRPRRTSTPRSTAPMTTTQRFRQTYSSLTARFYALSLLQKVLLILAGILCWVCLILFFIYNEKIFGWLAPLASRWRDIRGGWLILWFLTALVSLPPLIGYSTLLSLAGFVYGFPYGWPVVASATVVGSAISFVVSRYLIQNYVQRLMANDKRFAALALTIKHDGLRLLVMIRLCPLPYSLSNGALSTIPTVSLSKFVLATTAVTPKLLVHVFVGAQLGRLAEHGGDMDAKTKAVSYLSIAVGSLVGITTGWLIWRQTSKRARELEEQEASRVAREGVDRIRAEYADDPAALEAAIRLRESLDEDDISLRTEEDPWGFEDGANDAEEVGSYHDSPSEGDGGKPKR